MESAKPNAQEEVYSRSGARAMTRGRSLSTDDEICNAYVVNTYICHWVIAEVAASQLLAWGDYVAQVSLN
jgi:hypothetical protein